MVAVTADAGGDRAIATLQEDLRARRSPARAAEQLGYRFVARARLTNDPGYYKVAEQAAACLETLRPNNPAALLLRGHVLHQMHRFAEAEAIARRLVAQREFVLDFGLLGDALMEQGRLAEAGEAYQKMIDLKPFYQSYTRAAHLRWLRGDLDGAIALMQQAVKAASPRDPESIAWAYARLAVYELQAGRLTEADGRSSSVAAVRARLRAGAPRARTRLARRRRRTRRRRTSSRTRRGSIPLPEYQWVLADALRRLDRDDEASARRERSSFARARRRSADGRAVPVDTRARQRHARVELARREMANRRDIFTLDSLAWALASAGDVDEASAVMTTAARGGHRRRPSVRPRRGHRRGRWPRRRRRALGAQGSHAPLHPPALRARAARGGSRNTPSARGLRMNTSSIGAAAGRCSRNPASRALHGARIESHGCAAHHAGRCREHDRRLCVRLAAVRPEVSDDRARRVSARGARHRPEQVQLRRRRALRDPRRDRRGRGRGPNDLRLPVPLQHDVQEPEHHPAVVPRRHQRRRRRVAESDPALHGHEGRLPHRACRRASARASCRRTTRAIATPKYNRGNDGEQPAKDGVAIDSDLDRVHGRSRSPSSRTAIGRSPASATTASTPTSRRSSTC